MPKDANPSKSISVEVIFDLVNSVLRTADIDAKIIKGSFYEERVIADPGDREALKDILGKITDLSELERNSRLLFVGVIESDGREIPIVSKVYLRGDGTFRQELTLPLEVPLSSAEEFEDESIWWPRIDWAVKAFPIVLQIIEILIETRGS